MAGETGDLPPDGTPAPAQSVKQGRDWGRYWRTRLLAGLIALLGVIGLGAVLIDSPIGHRFIANSLASYAPASGLRVKIGRIEGSILGEAELTDVVLSDPKGEFLRVPEVELDWRPLHWFTRGLDVRRLVARRGHLMRMPELNPGDPDAPILPDFDIRIDRLAIEDLRVDKAIAGMERTVDFWATADITDGRARIEMLGDLGGEDRLLARLDADQSGDVIDLLVDYNAPAGGLLAGMAGASEDLQIAMGGKGKWTAWKGYARVRQGNGNLAAMTLTKQGEIYGLLGQIRSDGYLSGIAAEAVGEVVSINAQGTFKDSVIDGRYVLVGAGVEVLARGGVDLNANRLARFGVLARVTDPALAGPDLRADGLQARLGLDGNFREDLAIAYTVEAARIGAGDAHATRVVATGNGNWNGSRLQLPLAATADSIATGSAMVDPRLRGAKLDATITYSGDRLVAPDIVFDSSGLGARLALDGDVAQGRYRLTGPVIANGVVLEGLGSANARAQIDAVLGGNAGWTLAAKVDGRMSRVTNATLENYVGAPVAFNADVSMAANAPILIRSARLDAPRLDLSLSGERAVDGTVRLAGEGRHADFGPFTVDGTMDGEGPHAELVFAEPLPAAGVKDVRIALAPDEDGFLIDAEGQSMLGPFTGNIGIVSAADEPVRIAVNRLTLSDTTMSGDLTVEEGGVAGNLVLTGGGVEGSVALAPQSEGQGIDADIILRDASFQGQPPITVRLAHIKANGVLGDATTLDAAINAQGIGRGDLFLGRFAAEGRLEDGEGTFNAMVAGRRGSRFFLRMAGEVSNDRVEVAARGRYAGRRISMPRALVVLRDESGWNLQRSQIDFAGGTIQAEGRFGEETAASVRVVDMPLDVANLFVDDLDIGGKASGVVDYRRTAGAAPTVRARLLFDDLTRSGLVLTSRPVDLAMVAELTADDFETRTIIREDATRHGRLQMRLSNLPADGTLIERLRAGTLFAQLRYGGPADALWRLAAVELFDVTGDVRIAGDIRGSFDQPRIRGTLRGEGLRLQSTLTGTDVTDIAILGTFDGSVLRLPRFSGVSGNGTVSGSGSVDLSRLFTDGVSMDLRLAAKNARLLNRDDMAAVVSGPIRVVATDNVGTVAGRLEMISGRWKLGNTTAVENLPSIPRREINLPADRQTRKASSAPWRYLIDVQANNRFTVTGMGLDSEWGVDVRLRGNTDAPVIFGQADLVRGGYQFAGKRFDLTRGRISFSGENPPDPRLDVEAEADINDINATILIQGTAYAPEISFSSVPALPEEEVLSRLLFGDSVANISAPEALQLGAALAAFQSGGGGMDPINELRSAIGVDRLRVIGADEALGRGTSVAVGEYIGRDFYVELVTDGKGYSATELEFRVTSWLSLLGTVSSLGYNAVSAEISKDY
ncbi:translocation/assembly module TamB domain-containing protein [Croceicoccus sp. Ery15]|uniref:translocation/assembly module TamB domain-containing protein n=1 Tax=Croceicoccus sp. Ery15 TaxID=1703338 RepID=UPI001E315D86|nr:translocation/assembly module TamB domain-containing protein [Croceicoccus sp. Ery15]